GGSALQVARRAPHREPPVALLPDTAQGRARTGPGAGRSRSVKGGGPMKPKLLASTLLVVGLVAAWLVYDRLSRGQGSVYQGRTTSQWARTLRDWRLDSESWSYKWGRYSFWVREPSLLDKAREMLGVRVGGVDHYLPLLWGDAESVPVLTELLKDTDPKVRR